MHRNRQACFLAVPRQGFASPLRALDPMWRRVAATKRAAAKEDCPRACARGAECASTQKTSDRWEHVFFLAASPLNSPLAPSLIYGELASGRTYVESDPIGLAGGINTYSYALNQPTRYTDPDGRLVVALPWVVPPVVEGLVYIGSAAAAAWGLHKATQSDEQCKDKNCPPCKTVSGRVVPVDT
ncbi:MAG: hypothetical protein JF606_26310, partial [Burkholderiales bacterium]|nr:hypothetical protein [Burkholderiales bacterium]